MKKLKNSFKSVRIRLFVTLCTVIIFIIVFLILINNIVLETFYLYSKTNTIKNLYQKINDYYNSSNQNINLEDELKNIAIKNNIDILIKEESDTIVITTNKEFLGTIGKTNINTIINTEKSNIIYMKNHVVIKKIKDEKSGIRYIVLYATLDNSYKLYIRIPVSAIEESVKISNELLVLIGGIVILISGILASVISRKFTKPILELNNIANKMAKLDFSQKYRIKDTEDEINELGKSINSMSDKLERTINQLRGTNVELEKDIEEKSKIDEMRKQFISDVSHELKTPLTILKGHLTGMLNKVKGYENQESYMERSLAVVEKMETLVKELLYVSKTDGKQRTEYKTIDFAELLRVQIADVTDLLSEKEISLSVDIPDKILCDADPAQMERAIQNVLVNAIRYSPNGEAIYISLSNDKNTVSCKVENTGVHIPEEMIPHLFEAFYRADTSRNRNTGGTGLGLYIVRKIMELHHAKYGIQNTSRGVVFWLEMPQERGAINSI